MRRRIFDWKVAPTTNPAPVFCYFRLLHRSNPLSSEAFQIRMYSTVLEKKICHSKYASLKLMLWSFLGIKFHKFLSVLTERSQRTIVLPAFCDSCVCLSVVVVVTDKNWNFSAVRSPIELKLSGYLGLVSQMSLHALVSRLSFIYIL
jgi:hypothetical protein